MHFKGLYLPYFKLLVASPKVSGMYLYRLLCSLSLWMCSHACVTFFPCLLSITATEGVNIAFIYLKENTLWIEQRKCQMLSVDAILFLHEGEV